MAITKGAKNLFEWLKRQKAGSTVGYTEVMSIAGWSEKSLKTYLSKNKISPFLVRLDGDRLKVVLDGDQIGETFFNETFTQSAPRKLSLSSGDRLEGEHGVYELVEPLGNGAVGHVWSARSADTPALVAAKIMQPREGLFQESKLPNVRERFRREVRNGRACEHPHLVRYLDYGHTEKNPFLIMELAAVVNHLPDRNSGRQLV